MRYQDLSYSLGDTVIVLCHSRNNGESYVADAPVFRDEPLVLVECVVTGTAGPQFGELSPYSNLIRVTGSVGDREVTHNFQLNANAINQLLQSLDLNYTVNDQQRAFLRNFIMPVPAATRGYVRMLQDLARAAGAPANAVTNLQDVEDIRQQAETLGLRLVRLNRESVVLRSRFSPELTRVMSLWDTAGEPVREDPPEEDDDDDDDEREEF